MAKVEQEQQNQQGGGISTDAADQHRIAAIQKVPGMLRVLEGIASDQSCAAGPRVAAARAVCELGGLLGPAKELPEPLADMNVSEMSISDLERFISEGWKTPGQGGQEDPGVTETV